jgi:hypothetical protein
LTLVAVVSPDDTVKFREETPAELLARFDV